MLALLLAAALTCYDDLRCDEAVPGALGAFLQQFSP